MNELVNITCWALVNGSVNACKLVVGNWMRCSMESILIIWIAVREYLFGFWDVLFVDIEIGKLRAECCYCYDEMTLFDMINEHRLMCGVVEISFTGNNMAHEGIAMFLLCFLAAIRDSQGIIRKTRPATDDIIGIQSPKLLQNIWTY